jgi:hypothetical protein
MKRISMVLGIILLVFAGLWYFVLRNNFNQRFPDGWSWTFDSIGYSSYADEAGTFPEGTMVIDDPITISARQVTSDTVNAPAGQVRILDHFETYDPVTSEVTWELDFETFVDPKTGQYTEGDLVGNYYFLPQNVSRDQVYPIANTSYRGLEMSFREEVNLNGINTYLFAYYGDFNNEAAYPDTVLAENEAIICFDVELEYWVEPTTGEIVKYREWCEGDYIVNTGTGERVKAVQRWGAESTGDDLLRRSVEVQNILFQYQLVNLYLPIGLGILGIILLAFGATGTKKVQPS